MSKIAIVSQPGQGVIIDISGCASADEAAYHLSSTLQVPNGFWNDIELDLNFGQLELDVEQARRLLSVAGDAGVVPRQVFADSSKTKQSLSQLNLDAMHYSSTKDCSEDYSQAGECLTDVAVADSDLIETPPSAAGAPTPFVGKGAVPGVLYLKQTLRSGQSVNHKGHLVIVGDVNAGAEVTADGDITVWGSLRGVAHAGASGNTSAEIRALKIEAIQLRIANAIARAPDRSNQQAPAVHVGPETARMAGGVIRIATSALI